MKIKTVNKILFYFLSLVIFLMVLPFVNKADAAVIYFCSQNGSTIWGINASYRPSATGVNAGSDVSVSNVFVNSTSNIVSTCGTGFDHYYTLQVPGVSQFVDGDKISWSQACVDPTTLINIIPSKFGELNDTYVIDISCFNMGSTPANGEANNTYFYAGCGTNYNNLSTSINEGGSCTPPTNSQYCTAAENTNTNICSLPNRCSGQACISPIPTTPPPPSSPPTGLGATTRCSGTTPQANFSWNSVANATSYDVTWASAIQWSGSGTSTGYINLTDPAGTNRQWSVRGTNAGGNGPYASSTVVVPDCTTSPGASASMSCSAGAPRMDMTWGAVTGASQYIVTCYYYVGSTQTSCSASNPGRFDWTVAGTSYGFPGLPTNTTINWKIQPQNSSGGNIGTSSNGATNSGNPCTQTPTPTSGSGGVSCQQCDSTGACTTYTTANCTTNCNSCPGGGVTCQVFP